MFHSWLVKTVAVRQLRQRWPEVEALLKREGALFVTRDGVKVARLSHLKGTKERRARFAAKAHLAWVRSVYGRRRIRSVDALLDVDRADG